MNTIKKLEKGGDPVNFLIVVWDEVLGFGDYAGLYSHVELLLRAAGQSDEVISNVFDALDNYFDLLFGPLNFTYDYFFNGESPIPPGAR